MPAEAKVALSLTQPWASLVVSGRKRWETRGWRTHHRGRVIIHASKLMPPWARGAALGFDLDPAALPKGVLLGAVTIVRMVPTEEARLMLPDEELAMGDYSDGRWAWELADPVALPEPIPGRGALSLWPVPVETLDVLRAVSAPIR